MLADQVGSTAQLYFYDWEANLLDEECKTDPDLNANQRQPISGIFAAVDPGVQVHGRRHRHRARTRWPTTRRVASPSAAAKPRFYVFDKTTKKPFDGSSAVTDLRLA